MEKIRARGVLRSRHAWMGAEEAMKRRPEASEVTVGVSRSKRERAVGWRPGSGRTTSVTSRVPRFGAPQAEPDRALGERAVRFWFGPAGAGAAHRTAMRLDGGARTA